MAGILFIVTIPTEKDEREVEFKEKQSTLGHSSDSGIPCNESEKFEYGTFKISPPEGFLLDNEFKDEYVECVGLLNLPHDSSMECIMIELFKKFGIDNAVWHLSKNTKYHQITFFVESNTCHELVLTTLNEWGIGQRNGSCMSMIPCAIYNQSSKSSNDTHRPRTASMSEQKQTAWKKFISSVHARWNVAQIVQQVREDATMTFDFVTLILVAGMLAAFGLIDNDTTTLISSMLISPLMGPVIATIFGIVIKDYSLIRFGLLNEVIGILLATAIGFVFGLIVFTIDGKYAYGTEAALTSEMIRRCEFHSLVFGVFTALPTGAAAAIAILGENFGPLVGVAISVSLLPPAVNAGVLWALAVLYKLNENDESLYSKIIMTNYYSNHQSIELAVYGGISMLLSIANVICILVVGVLTLKIKEVAPGTTRNQQRLWNHDIKVARNYNASGSSGDPVSQQLVDGISALRSNEEKIKSMYRETYQRTWSSGTQIPRYSGNTLSDLEGVSLCMEFPTSPSPTFNQFDTQYFMESKNHYTRRRSTLPYSNKTSMPRSPSLFSDFQVMNRFRLEKIPEVPNTSSNETEQDNDDDNNNENKIQTPDNTSNSSTTSSSDNLHTSLAISINADDSK